MCHYSLVRHCYMRRILDCHELFMNSFQHCVAIHHQSISSSTTFQKSTGYDDGIPITKMRVSKQWIETDNSTINRPLVSGDVAIALLKRQLNGILWVMQCVQNQRLLVFYQTHLVTEISANLLQSLLTVTTYTYKWRPRRRRSNSTEMLHIALAWFTQLDTHCRRKLASSICKSSAEKMQL